MKHLDTAVYKPPLFFFNAEQTKTFNSLCLRLQEELWEFLLLCTIRIFTCLLFPGRQKHPFLSDTIINATGFRNHRPAVQIPNVCHCIVFVFKIYQLDQASSSRVQVKASMWRKSFCISKHDIKTSARNSLIKDLLNMWVRMFFLTFSVVWKEATDFPSLINAC